MPQSYGCNSAMKPCWQETPIAMMSKNQLCKLFRAEARLRDMRPVDRNPEGFAHISGTKRVKSLGSADFVKEVCVDYAAEVLADCRPGLLVPHRQAGWASMSKSRIGCLTLTQLNVKPKSGYKQM